MDELEIDLVKQAKKGSQIAFGQLYNKYKPMVESTARMYSKDQDDVDDLTSTVFIKVFKKLNTFVTNDSFEKWVKTIAINTCIDYTRKIKRDQVLVYVDNDENSIQLPSEDDDPEELLVRKEISQELADAKEILTEKQFEVMQLYYSEGYLYREIAEKLALPLGSVKSEIHRAKLKLNKVLTSNNKSQ